MELTQLEEILAVFANERRVFHYFRDRYALLLLQQYIGKKAVPISQLKQSPYARLLNKNVVQQAMSLAGGHTLTAKHLQMVWDTKPLYFVTTLTSWGDPKEWYWSQMSRKGYHLVLQLNMANDHTQKYNRLVKPYDRYSFANWSHPVLQEGIHETLAWARIDLDFGSDEALIEEIQSDWVREVKAAIQYEEYCDDRELKDLQIYANGVLAPYSRVWSEAMLSAAIELIRKDLGINNIFYHSFETGAELKHISDYKPPRSLYTDLPKRFAMQRTEQGPDFLMQEKQVRKRLRKVQDPFWFKLPADL